MRITKVLLSVILTTSFSGFSQNSDYKLAITPSLGISDYYGDLGTEFFDFGHATRGIGGLNISYYLNPFLTIGASGSYGGFGHLSEAGHFRSNLLQANAQLRFMFNNGKMLAEESKIQPYIFAGAGLAHYRPSGSLLTLKGTDGAMVAGIGANYMISERIGLNYNLTYGYTSGDNRDLLSGKTGGNDQFMLHQFGVSFLLGKKQDADGDGVSDKKDNCPEIAGTSDMNGCPDQDGDKIADKDDECPTVAGVESNNGCPEIKAEVIEVFNKAITDIQFETGSDVIKSSSYAILDNVATIMLENKTYKLEIDGHTDSSGDDQKNMVLSQKRAESVKAYLEGKGVENSRLIAKGFGETQPTATNETEEGRAKNRRVEFKILF